MKLVLIGVLILCSLASYSQDVVKNSTTFEEKEQKMIDYSNIVYRVMKNIVYRVMKVMYLITT